MSDSQNNVQFSRGSIHLGVRYNFLFNPFDPITLYKVLKNLSYKFPPEIEQNNSLDVDGIIAQKDKLIFSISKQNNIIAIDSNKNEDLVKELTLIESSLSRELAIDFLSKTMFSEVIIHYTARTGNNPLTVFSNMGKKFPLISEMSTLLDQEVSPSSYKVSPSNTSVNMEDWFDFLIEPLSNNSETFYHIGITFRNKSRKTVESFLSNHQDIIVQSIKLIESYSMNK